MRELPPTWQPAPWIGDEPVTATERLWEALDRLSPVWHRAGGPWAVYAVLAALAWHIAVGWR